MLNYRSESRLRQRSGVHKQNQKEHRVLTSLSKGLRLLLELGRASKPLRLTDLSREMGLNKATTVRILSTLEQLAFVQRNREDRTYRIGPSAFVGLHRGPFPRLPHSWSKSRPSVRRVLLRTTRKATRDFSQYRFRFIVPPGNQRLP